jgi:hypothetical protein
MLALIEETREAEVTLTYGSQGSYNQPTCGGSSYIQLWPMI